VHFVEGVAAFRAGMPLLVVGDGTLVITPDQDFAMGASENRQIGAADGVAAGGTEQISCYTALTF